MFCWWLCCFQDHCLLSVAMLLLGAVLFLVTYGYQTSISPLFPLTFHHSLALPGSHWTFEMNLIIQRTNVWRWLDFPGILFYMATVFFHSSVKSTWNHIFPKHLNKQAFKALTIMPGPRSPLRTKAYWVAFSWKPVAYFQPEYPYQFWQAI